MSRTTNIEQTFSAEEITSIHLTSTFANIRVTKSEDKEVHVLCNSVPEGSRVEVQGGRLIVELREVGIAERIFLNPFKNAYCTIALPEMILESVAMKTGAGNTDTESLACGRFELDTGAGEVKLNGITAKESIRIEAGAGNVDITELKGGKLNIRTGAGNISIKGETDGLLAKTGTGNMRFDGTVYGDIDISGGIGDTALTLRNPASDFSGKYTLKTTTGIGKVTINYI